MSTTDPNVVSTGSPDPSSWTHLTLERRNAAYWRVTFDHPPINTITATTVTELFELVDLIEREPELNVVVFDSANPDFFLAHYDTENDPARTLSMPPGPTGMHPWLDLMARLSRAPVVSIAAIRGRARGAGSEFVLACDLRFASRENTLLGQFEVGAGLHPRRRSDGPAARGSSGAAARSRSSSSPTTSMVPAPSSTATSTAPSRTTELDDEVDAIASRLARFDHEAIARTKSHVDQVTLAARQRAPPGAAGLLRRHSAARDRRRARPGSRSSGSTPTATSSATSAGASSKPARTSPDEQSLDGDNLVVAVSGVRGDHDHTRESAEHRTPRRRRAERRGRAGSRARHGRRERRQPCRERAPGGGARGLGPALR